MALNCDIETGTCSVGELTPKKPQQAKEYLHDMALIYIGDPMCSWCWGSSNVVKEARAFALEKGIQFSAIVGGLRPGGGDEWNDAMKRFLRKEWANIQQATKQPFSFKILDREQFNYDTEPSCRAVVVARDLWQGQDDNDQKLLEFFSAIQYKFYVGGEDPTSLDFYKSICLEHHIDFDKFSALFESDEAKNKTHEEFLLNRSWNIRGFPSFALRVGNQVTPIGSGYMQIETINQAIETAITQVKQAKLGK